jgi:hypothetical protein
MVATRGDMIERKVADRIVKNEIFLRELRRKLKDRQPDNEVFHRLVDQTSDQVPVDHYLKAPLNRRDRWRK